MRDAFRTRERAAAIGPCLDRNRREFGRQVRAASAKAPPSKGPGQGTGRDDTRPRQPSRSRPASIAQSDGGENIFQDHWTLLKYPRIPQLLLSRKPIRRIPALSPAGTAINFRIAPGVCDTGTPGTPSKFHDHVAHRSGSRRRTIRFPDHDNFTACPAVSRLTTGGFFNGDADASSSHPPLELRTPRRSTVPPPVLQRLRGFDILSARRVLRSASRLMGSTRSTRRRICRKSAG